MNPTLAPGIREKSFTFLPAEGNYWPAPDAGPNTGNRRAWPRSWVLTNRRFGGGTDFRKRKTTPPKPLTLPSTPAPLAESLVPTPAGRGQQVEGETRGRLQKKRGENRKVTLFADGILQIRGLLQLPGLPNEFRIAGEKKWLLLGTL